MSSNKPVVPRFEPEVVEAHARRQYNGDIERVATTSVKIAEVHGVALSSRFDKAHEFESMATMVEGVSSELRCFIDSIWCDSKAVACYSVILKPCTRGQAQTIADQLDTACRARDGGHNGISIQGANGGGLDVDPYWIGDFGE